MSAAACKVLLCGAKAMDIQSEGLDAIAEDLLPVAPKPSRKIRTRLAKIRRLATEIAAETDNIPV